MGNIDEIRLFQPEKRQALLVNLYDQPGLFFSISRPNESTYHRLEPLARGNQSIYQMEAALRRGNLDLDEEISYVLSGFFSQDSQVSLEEINKRVREISAKVKEIYNKTLEKDDENLGYQLIFQNFSDRLDCFVALKVLGIYYMVNPSYYCVLPPIFYQSVKKVFPDDTNAKEKVYNILSLYSKMADENTLTFFFIRAHGLPDKIDEIPYHELLDRLDTIKGKKVLIVLACYSGSLLSHIRWRSKRDDYLVITSTSAGKKGWNRNEDEILDDITDGIIRKNKTLSCFGSKIYSKVERQIASSFISTFDVIL